MQLGNRLICFASSGFGKLINFFIEAPKRTNFVPLALSVQLTQVCTIFVRFDCVVVKRETLNLSTFVGIIRIAKIIFDRF